MTKTKSTKRALLMSALALLMCVSMLIGSTFAWFTDSVTSGVNKIVAGNLDIGVYYATPTDVVNGDIPAENWKPVTAEDSLFNNDALWEPGYTEAVFLKFVNEGSLALQYQLQVDILEEVIGKNREGKDIQLSNYIQAYACNSFSWDYKDYLFTDRDSATNPAGAPDPYFDTLYNAANGGVATPSGDNPLSLDSWQWLEPEEITYATLVLWMPETVENEANHNGKNIPQIDLGISVVATQYTWEKDSFGSDYDKDATYPEINMVDTWDGTTDTSWYNETDTEFTLTTAEQLAGLADLVDAGNNFEGKTIKLANEIDLYLEDENGELVSFNPIGYGYDIVFKGTFDGQGHTIKNLYQNGWALGLSYGTQGGGLFASVVDAIIKNINIDNAEVVMECVDMGVLVGYSYGNCTYENITVSNSLIANYQRYTGGVVGEVNGTQTFKNVDVKDTVISSLWGDFDCSLGGIIGGKWGDAVVTMENCDVACELNAYNDVTSSYQWYAYRRAGMLIGNSEETKTEEGRTSATASYLTAVNCTVTYGDWVNYTYCEFAGQNWPYVRVQEGYSNSAYSNPRYGHPIDANGNEVVDDTHVHNEGEDHFILCEFDQLFGGGQGVYGTATHDGVTVIYPND